MRGTLRALSSCSTGSELRAQRSLHLWVGITCSAHYMCNNIGFATILLHRETQRDDVRDGEMQCEREREREREREHILRSQRFWVCSQQHILSLVCVCSVQLSWSLSESLSFQCLHSNVCAEPESLFIAGALQCQYWAQLWTRCLAQCLCSMHYLYVDYVYYGCAVDVGLMCCQCSHNCGQLFAHIL